MKQLNNNYFQGQQVNLPEGLYIHIYIYASRWKAARVVVQLFEYGGWVGWGGVGWGGILTFMHLAYIRGYIRGCYAVATSLVMGWVGWGWDINVHVPCVHTWMLRCCYVTGHGLGGVGLGY